MPHAVPTGADAAPLIAIVNDDTVFLSLMEDLLHDEGYRTLVIRASTEAYALIKGVLPALVVLDIRVGNEDSGWLVLDLVRLDPRTRDIPFIVCSTDPRLLAAKAATLRAKHCDTLEKPFDLDDLLAKIAHHIGPTRRAAAD